MSAPRFVLPLQTVVNALGVIPGAKLFFYVSGTSTPENTYSDDALTIPNSNPVVADGNGLFPNIFLGSQPYKVVLTDSADDQIWTADPVDAFSVAGSGFGVQEPINSATTTDLGTIGTQNVLVNGAVSISGFGATAVTGLPYLVEFSQALSLVYDGTKLILPGSANITTATGDALLALPLGGGNWRVLAYWKADGTTLFQGFGPQQSLASATTTDLGTVPSRNVLVTGAATVSSFGASAPTGVPYLVEFSGAATLDYDGTALILPSHANITAAAGDTLLALPTGAGNWRVLAYWKSDGSPVSIVGAEASITSATTTDLGSITANFIKITGTTSINSFGSTATLLNPIRLITFAGSLTLVQNSSMTLPGGNNITTAANDFAIAQYLGSNNWQVLGYFPANTPISSGNTWVEIISGSVADGDAQKNFVLTSYLTAYKRFTIEFDNVLAKAGSTNYIGLQLAVAGTFITANYIWNYVGSDTNSSTSDSAAHVMNPTVNTANPYAFKVDLFGIGAANGVQYIANSVGVDSGGTGHAVMGTGSLLTASIVDEVGFFVSGANRFHSGNYRVLGLAN